AGGDFDILSVPADGSGSPTPLTFGTSNDVDPAYSPDGTRLAFASDRTGDNEIFVKTFGGSLVQLTNVPAASDTQPTWSPDGSMIAFTSDRSGTDEIYVKPSDGSGAAVLIPSPPRASNSDPARAPA